MKILTNDWEVIYEYGSFKLFSELSEGDKRIYHLIDENYLPNQTSIKIYQKEKNIVVASKRIEWRFGQNRFYPKSVFNTLATITPTRVFSTNPHHAIECICRYLREQYLGGVTKTSLRLLVTKGYDAYSEYVKERIELSGTYSPFNLKTFTDNPDVFLHRMNGNRELCDLYSQAIKLNRKIKMSWSDRKIHDIHMKWTEEIHKLKCRNCSTKSIWENIPELPENVELLNSERRIADEGINMHHCIYTNYNDILTNHKAIAFHVKGYNPYTVMFTVNIYGDSVSFSQAYHAWNKPLTNEEKEFALKLETIANNINENNPILNRIDIKETPTFPLPF